MTGLKSIRIKPSSNSTAIFSTAMATAFSGRKTHSLVSTA